MNVRRRVETTINIEYFERKIFSQSYSNSVVRRSSEFESVQEVDSTTGHHERTI
jgi:hypothetical protein